jgi:type I restriction enzyme S subunit
MTFYKETDLKETPIGNLPKAWEVIRLGDAITYKKGTKPKTLLVREERGTLPYLTADVIRTGTFTQWAKETDEFVRVNRDDLILIWDGFYCGDAFTGFVGILSSTMIKIQPKRSFDKHFLFYLIRTYFNELNTKISGMYLKHVDKSVFEALRLPFPPLSEQQKIAEVLSTVDEAIQKTSQVIAKTGRLKKGLMQELLTKGIGHKEFKDTEIGRIPKEWEVVRIGDLGEVITGTTPSTSVKEYWNGECPFVTPTDMTESKYVDKTERGVTEKGLQKGRLIPKDSVLVTCIASIGKIALASEHCITNQQINAIVCNKGVDAHYVYYAIAFRNDVLKAWAGRTTNRIVKKSLFEKFLLPLPPRTEQRQIADILAAVDKKLELERNEKAKLERIKQGMMDFLLTGKVRVKV